jgi:AIG2 family protein
VHYFSYGSNMSIKRLKSRVASAKKVGIGILDMHELKFHKVGQKDDSGKCDVSETGEPEHAVHGVVYHIPEHEKPELDRIEGVGHGYEVKDVLIKLIDGSLIKAFTYYATHIDSLLRPLDWYKEHVMIGVQENNFPEDYVQVLEAVEFDEDPDEKRRDRELSIYR